MTLGANTTLTSTGSGAINLASTVNGAFSLTAKIDPPLEDGYDAYDPVKKWGKGGGIWKTTDGGKTFRKLVRGLPTCETGRIGLDYYRKDPNVVFAIIDAQKIGMGRVPGYLGVTSEDAPKEAGARASGSRRALLAAAVGALSARVRAVQCVRAHPLYRLATGANSRNRRRVIRLAVRHPEGVCNGELPVDVGVELVEELVEFVEAEGAPGITLRHDLSRRRRRVDRRRVDGDQES